MFVYSINDASGNKKPLSDPRAMHFGISYISSFLKKRGHETKLLVLAKELKNENRNLIDIHLSVFSPNLICFTAVASEYSFILEMSKYIKQQYPTIFQLVGGTHVTLNPENCIFDGFDGLCIGEGEFPTLELVEQISNGESPHGIKNLWIKNGKSIEKNPPRDFIKDLDEIPFPDWNMWKEWVQVSSDSAFSILLGRGCPFRCTYCSNHALRKIAHGSYVRYRSPKNIISEIKERIKNNPEIKEYYLEVETIGVNSQWEFDLFSKLKELNNEYNQKLSFGTNLRVTPNLDIERFFREIKSANFKKVNMGLESGSEKIRSQVLNRHYSNEKFVKTVECAKANKIEVTINNLIGIPGETEKNFRETINITRKCQPDGLQTSVYYPYPGTDLYKLCKQRGLISETRNPVAEREETVLDLPEFNRKQIKKQLVWFVYNVYKGYIPTTVLLMKVMLKRFQISYTGRQMFKNRTFIALLAFLRKLLIKR